MINEIWENIKSAFSIVYEKIVSKLIKPIYFTFAIFGFYCFINYLIHYEILLAFGSLFAAVVCFKLFEEEK